MNKRMKYETRVWQPFQREAYHWAWHDKYLIGVIQELGHDLRRIHQRIWRGYCDYDIFSIFSWFLGIMPTMLQEYKDNLHGCPDAPGLISHRVFLDDSEKEGNAVVYKQAVRISEGVGKTPAPSSPFTGAIPAETAFCYLLFKS